MDKEIKCIVWDLDNTIWEGTLLENEQVHLKPGIIDIIKELDERGILHSIASKNNYQDAMNKLIEFDIAQYFLYPEIGWNAKSKSIFQIQQNLNVGMDTILFIDDQPFERDEVKAVHPETTCVDAAKYQSLLSFSRLTPRFITQDSKRRRTMYLEDIRRKKDEETFQGPSEKFLASLNMKFIISMALEEDLKRAEELTVRTNQLNATGKTYSYEELNTFRTSEHYKLLICELTDTYGSYGKIGLALVAINDDFWCLKMLLMSCRVMSRGVGTVLLLYIMKQAKENGRKLFADFVKTDRNRIMYITYKLLNFKETLLDNVGYVILENDLSQIPEFPRYIQVEMQ